jgi:hypothetical protein
MSQHSVCRQIVGNCVPAVRVTQSRDSGADRNKSSVGRDRVRRDSRSIIAPAGPVSDTSAAPLRAKDTENAPGSGLRLTTIGASVPSAWTRKASILFVARSVTRNWPSGLKASDAASELLVVRNRIELGSEVAPQHLT